ncbi:MAG: hypothetical protein M1823_002211 [Watsoniomyces obsoletus]|nr:MAG: hypothetical protein M1823_002211 [Watsoniomyces obsoletus]
MVSVSATVDPGKQPDREPSPDQVDGRGDGKADAGIGSRERNDAPNQSAKEPRYVLFPAHTVLRSRTSPPLTREREEFERSLFADGGSPNVAKRKGSVRHLLTTPAMFRRKNSEPASLKTDSGDAGRTMPVEERVRKLSRAVLHERSSSAPGWWRQGASGPAPPKVPAHRKAPSHAESMMPTVKRKPLAPQVLERLVIPEVGTESWRLRSPPSGNAGSRDGSVAPVPPPKEFRFEASPRPKVYRTPTNLSSVSLVSNHSATAPITAPEENFHRPPWASPTPPSAQSATHQRLPSEASVLDRGRSRRRRDDERRRLRKSGHIDGSSEWKLPDALPTGSRPVDAPSRLTAKDISKLYRQAQGQAAQFEVLDVKDVESLSKELRALDERCEYLRKTHMSLRSDRQGLHSRIVAHLKSPRLVDLSRESMLKHERALADIDLAIDDWMSKLDRAENRRTRVRQKLLEHVAAAVTLRPQSVVGPSKHPARHSSPPAHRRPPSPPQTAGDISVRAPQLPEMAFGASPSDELHIGLGLPLGITLGVSGDGTPPRTPPSPSEPLWEGPRHVSMKHSSPTVVSTELRNEKGTENPTQAVPDRRPDTVEDIGYAETHAARREVESIRIYADSNVCGLFAQVEQEIGRMSGISNAYARDDPDAVGPKGERKPEDSPETTEVMKEEKKTEKLVLLPVQMMTGELDRYEYLDSRQYVP